MIVLEMSRPMHPFGFDGGRPLSHSHSHSLSHSPDSSPFAGSVNSAGFESRRCTTTTAAADDEGSTRTHSHSQIPRVYSDLPPATSGASVSSSRRSSSGYGSTVAADRVPDYGSHSDRGRSFDSPGRDQHALAAGQPYHPGFHNYSPRHSSSTAPSSASSAAPPSVAAQQPLPYHQSSRPSQGQSQGHPAGTHLPFAPGPSPYQQHPSRVQSRSSDSTRSYQPQHPHAHPHQPQHQPQLQHPQQPMAHPQAHHTYHADYSPDYYGARYRSHEQQPHHSVLGMNGMNGMNGINGINGIRHRRSSISKATKKRRGNLPKEYTDMFQEWLYKHINHPYPSDEEKHDFIRRTGLDMISNWFINARRRKLPDMVRNLDGDAHSASLGPSDME
ncbi:homeobox transcription [Ophiostoma piceae UAMH 11346]|uniref:Homeobox transcription n=1 Tax=Ophiostoma piceae (strain UAMH 11346) TaxID=1262450 RepID=S3CA70_OPHP1|nr:homeobox transcription [Ophiostoma piceae UAMH 11346]